MAALTLRDCSNSSVAKAALLAEDTAGLKSRRIKTEACAEIFSVLVGYGVGEAGQAQLRKAVALGSVIAQA